MATATLAPITRRTCVSALLGACFAPAVLAQAQPPTPSQPLPRMWVREGGSLPVRLDSVSLRTEVVGHAVQSRVELVFHNPNARVLEGELQFPLNDGQWVSGFELDIDGELRPAVVVDKARGQQVFEDVIRARVDPALLEVTEGHNYKLRVYPLPPQGTRRVVLHIAQTLGRDGRLVLPLRFADKPVRIDVHVLVAGVPVGDITVAAAGLPPQAISRQQNAPGWAQVFVQPEDARDVQSLQITLPVRHEPVVMTQRFAGQQHFYAELPAPALAAAPRARPRRLALLWDASGSGARRDHGREFALLDAYLRALGNVELTLIVGRDVAEAPQRFSVKRGEWHELRRVLGGLAYDGASNLPALLATQGHDLALLFSDGLSNWGRGAPAASTVPLYAVADANGAHTTALRQLAERRGGEWLDLAALTPAEAARALQTRKPRLVRLHSHQARDLVAASPYAASGHYAVAGVLTQPSAEVTLEFELPDGRTARQTLSVQPHAAGATQVAQRWAGLRMVELEADYDDRRAEISRLGRSHGLVSRETSLIVLEALNDYVRFEIEPPANLRPDYERALAQQVQRRQRSQSQHLDRVAARFAEQVAWWEKEFPKDALPPRQVPKREQETQRQGGLGVQEMLSSARAGSPLASPAAPAPAERRMANADSAERKAKSGAPAADGPAPATIRLQPWTPDVPYARRLRAAAPEVVYQRYLDERPDHTNSTAFFLDAADVLFAKQKPELAMRVLSNLAEMDLENRHILRVLGYRLLQARAPQLAVPVLQKVQRLSPNEPQSWRDLGLAHAEAQQWQEAVDQLWQVVSRPWDGRFPDIDLTANAEMNMVIARAERSGQRVKTDEIDRRFLRALPLDLRITLAWDADNTDIDLWVTDPNGEQVYYGHRLSHQGGRISRDATGGYGPEEFALKVAKPGRYVVQARFYGHRQQVVSPATTLMLVLSTGFGRADQKDERVTLRLSGPAEMVTVGSFEVGGG
jgi:Ca-activated chloride channel family protein